LSESGVITFIQSLTIGRNEKTIILTALVQDEEFIPLFKNPDFFLKLINSTHGSYRYDVIRVLFENLSIKTQLYASISLNQLQTLLPEVNAKTNVLFLHPSLENNANKVRAEFIKVYRALRAGQSSFFKSSDWVSKNNIENIHPNQAIKLMAAHALVKDSRSAEAWQLLMSHGVCSENVNALNSIYKYAFNHSGLFKRHVGSDANLNPFKAEDIHNNEFPAGSRRESIISTMRPGSRS
jgi:hypothetical protein